VRNRTDAPQMGARLCDLIYHFVPFCRAAL